MDLEESSYSYEDQIFTAYIENVTHVEPELSPVAVTVYYTAGVIVIFGGLIGNFLVLLVGIRHVKLSIPSHLHILNLAFCNASLFVILLVIFLTEVVIPGSFSCKLHEFLLRVVAAAASLILLVMSVDRFFFHSNPSTVTKLRGASRTVVWAVWAVSVLHATPTFIFTTKIGEPGQELCHSDLSHSTHLFYQILHIIISLLAFIFFVLAIVKSCRASRTLNENGAGGQLREPLIVNKCTLWILGSCLMIPLPKFIIHELSGFFVHEQEMSPNVRFLLWSLIPVLSESYLLAPPIFCFFLPTEYKMGLQKMFTCSKPVSAPQVPYTRHDDEEGLGPEVSVSTGRSRESDGSCEELCTTKL